MRTKAHALFLAIAGVLTAVFITFGLMRPAYGFISIRSAQTGAVAHWNEGSQLIYRLNTSNSSGLSPSDIFSIFTTSLQRWKQDAMGGFNFTYYQGTDTNLYPNYLGSSGDNSIFFTSNADSSDQLPCGVIALTEVWFDPSSGSIAKADLRFNDKCYHFTMNPYDTRSQSNIYLGDVATHELGHSLGLDHSQNLQASMVFTAAPEMSRPSCDDHTAMMALYGGGNRGRSGSLTGRVVSPSGSAIFGANVNAIELERGVVLASAITDRDGSFHLDGLEGAHYAIDVEPYFPGAAALSGYYKDINSKVCSGQNFNRTFDLNGQTLRSFSVTPGGSTNAGTITVSCNPPGSQYYSKENYFNSAPTIVAANLTTPVAVQSSFDHASDHYYRLVGQSGYLQAHAQAFSLYSPEDLVVQFLDQYGNPLSQQNDQVDDFQSTISQYVNFDATASVNLSTPQDVYVHVYPRSQVSSQDFPSGSLGVSNSLYSVLSVSRGLPADALYPADARCEGTDQFGPYPNQGQAPPLPSSNQGQSQSSSAGCGQLLGVDHDPMGPGGSARIANFALLVLGLWLARKKLRRVS